MSDAFDVPTEIAEVTIVGPLPLPVTGVITTSPDVNIHDSSGNSLNSTGTSLNVDVTNIVPVSGPLTDTQLRAAVVPVTIPLPVPVTDNGGSLTIDGTVSVSGSVAVTGPLTDIQLRATPVPISGTITTTPSGTQDVRLVATTITQPISAISLPLPTGAATEIKQTQPGVDIGDVTINNATGAAAVNIQDGGNSITVDGIVAVSNFPATQPISGTVTANQGTSPWVVSGSIGTSPNVNVHDGSGNTIASTGTSLNVDVTNTVPVTGTFFQATQPVSGVGNFTVIQPTGTNLHTTVDNFPATQPISGTVAATQSGEWDVNIEDTAGNALTSTGNALDVNIKSTGVTQPVSGPLTDTQLRATPPLVGIDQTGDNNDVDVINGAGAAAVNIQDGGNSITVDGTITSIFGTSSLSNGTQTTVSSSAVQILASNANRKWAVIQNVGVSNIRVGITGVTATTGILVVPNGNITFQMPNIPTNAIFAIRDGSVDSIALAIEAV